MKKNKNDFLKPREKGDPLRIHRKISLLLTPYVAKTPITANQVTILSILLVFFVGYLIAVGNNYYYFLAAGICLQIFMVLDHIDGSLARLKNQASPIGHWLDSTAHRVMNFVLFFGIAWNIGTIMAWILAFVSVYGVLMVDNQNNFFIYNSKKGSTRTIKSAKDWGYIRFLLFHPNAMTNMFTVIFVSYQIKLGLLLFAGYISFYLLASYIYYTKRLLTEG